MGFNTEFFAFSNNQYEADIVNATRPSSHNVLFFTSLQMPINLNIHGIIKRFKSVSILT
jgi:hypothetical protein